MYCPICGEKIKNQAEGCPSCGYKERQVSDEKRLQTGTEILNQQPTSGGQQYYYGASPQKAEKEIPIALMVISILAIVYIPISFWIGIIEGVILMTRPWPSYQKFGKVMLIVGLVTMAIYPLVFFGFLGLGLMMPWLAS